MAVNLLSDELKSDMTYLIPPITKEQIVKETNALIYHFKKFGICYEGDVSYPSSSSYLANITPETVVSASHGSAAQSYINRLDFLYIPVEFGDIINQINLIINILKSGIITSSYFFEQMRNAIYVNTSSISIRNGYAALDYSNDLNTRISSISNIFLPATYETVIDTLNSIIALFKINARIIDAHDFTLLIYDLQLEAEFSGRRNYGSASDTTFTDEIDYGGANTVTEEFQSNLELN